MAILIKPTSVAEFISLVDFYANILLRSQFIKFNNIEQAKALVSTAIISGVDPLSVVLAFDIIGGRLSKKSSAMLAEYKQRGGAYKILSRTADLASIELTHDGQTHTFSLSWSDVQQESYCYEKDGKTLKPRYATPFSRSQMMWARLVSDSVRAVMPEVTGGYYTPEEMQDVIEGECTTVTAGALPAPGVTVESTVDVNAAALMEQSQTATEQVAASQSIVATQIDVMISAEQVRELNALFQTCGVSPENIAKSLAKRSVSRVEDLTAVQAIEIITTLRDRAAALSAPITPELDAKIQEAIKLRAQVAGGTTIVEACKIHLETHKLGIHQLTVGDAQRLLAAIDQGDPKLFIATPLVTPGKA